jgi:hypothetical protein
VNFKILKNLFSNLMKYDFLTTKILKLFEIISINRYFLVMEFRSEELLLRQLHSYLFFYWCNIFSDSENNSIPVQTQYQRIWASKWQKKFFGAENLIRNQTNGNIKRKSWTYKRRTDKVLLTRELSLLYYLNGRIYLYHL